MDKIVGLQGRDDLVTDLVTEIRKGKHVILTGSVGVGKSAVLRAALDKVSDKVELLIRLYDHQAKGQFVEMARQMLELVDTGEGVLIMSDIYGATPANLAMKLLEPGRIEGLAGVNLPMLLRALTYRDKDMATLVSRATAGGRDGVLNMLSR